MLFPLCLQRLHLILKHPETTPYTILKEQLINAQLPQHNAAYSNYSTLKNWETGSQPNFGDACNSC